MTKKQIVKESSLTIDDVIHYVWYKIYFHLKKKNNGDGEGDNSEAEELLEDDHINDNSETHNRDIT